MRLQKYFLVSLLVLASCRPLTNSRGNVIAEQNIDSFVIGQTTMRDVVEYCGTPSLHKDNFTWIYMGGVSEETSFKGVTMANRTIIKLIFDNNQILKDKVIIKPNQPEYKFNKEFTDLLSKKETDTLLKKNHE